MKGLKLIIVGLVLLISTSVQSQTTVNVNIGTAPQWGPVGYSGARYYYLPDVESYYDIQTAMFIYNVNGNWKRKKYLPTRYKNYDLYRGYKVVMVDYYGTKPYYNFKTYKVKYKKGYQGKAQKTIGAKPGKAKADKAIKAKPAKQQKQNVKPKAAPNKPAKKINKAPKQEFQKSNKQEFKNSPKEMRAPQQSNGGHKGGNGGGPGGGGNGGGNGGGKGKK